MHTPVRRVRRALAAALAAVVLVVAPALPAIADTSEVPVISGDYPTEQRELAHTVHWSSVDGVKALFGYQVRIATSPDVNGSGALARDYYELLSSTTQQTFATLQEVTYYAQVRARFPSGFLGLGTRYGAWSSPVAITIDRTGPSPVVLSAPADGAVSNDSTPTLSWSGPADAVSYDVRAAGLENYDGDGRLLDHLVFWADSTTSTEITTPEIAEGTYYWQVRARDALGNRGPWTDAWSGEIDLTPPAAVSLVAPDDSTLHATNDVALSWTDAGESPVSYEVRASSSAPTDGVLPDDHSTVVDDATSASTTALALGDGAWNWQVRAIDEAGNGGPWSGVWSFVIDTVAPAVTIAAPTAGTATNGSAVVRIEADIVDDNPEQVVLELYGAVIDTDTTGVTSYAFDVDVSALSDGTHELTITATDALGLSDASSTASVEFLLDRTAPVLTVDGPAPGDVTAGPVGVSGTALDAESGILDGEVELALSPRDGSGVCGAPVGTTAATIDGADAWAGSFDTSALGDGEYCVSVTTVNSAGSATTAHVAPVTLDATAPLVSITGPAGGTAVLPGTDVSVTGEIDDEHPWIVSLSRNGTVVHSQSGATSTSFSTTLSTTGLADGAHALVLTVWDRAGNTAASLPVSLVVDSTLPQPPTVPLTPPTTTAPAALTPEPVENSSDDTAEETSEQEQLPTEAVESDAGEPQEEAEAAVEPTEGSLWWLWLLLVLVALIVTYAVWRRMRSQSRTA